MVARVRSFLQAVSLSFVVPTLLAAQTATIAGHVRGEAGNPLSGASVTIADLGVGATARENGEYSFTVAASRVHGQTVTLTARVIGYRANTVQMTLNPGASTHD